MKLRWYLGSILFILIFQTVFVINKILLPSQQSQEFDVYDDVLITLYNNCNFSLRNIMVFDNDSSSTAARALSNLQVPVGIKLKSLVEIDNAYRTSKVDPIEIEGIVVVINDGDTWPLIRENIATYWDLRNGCVIILVVKVPGACQFPPVLLQTMAELHFAMTYYICMHENFTEPAIYTHDPYGDTKPPNWLKVDQQVVFLLNWTLYRRIYDEADTCKGFIFNRTLLTKQTPVMIAISREIAARKETKYIHSGDARNITGVVVIPNIIKLERLLNMKFTYYVHLYVIGTNNNKRRDALMTSTPVNIILDDIIYGGRKLYRVVSYPTSYDHFVIISKDKGSATPLEKIANFYGIWTLVSLIVISLLCFLVIWFKTGGRISSAIFDILRLLINSGIVTPIDTLPLKIFFTMIFLYFIVIQSTFSGQLSKFLTVPEYLSNIDSLADLADPSVKNINTFCFVLNSDHRLHEVLAKKHVVWGSQTTCWTAIVNTTNDVCIGPYWPFLRTIILSNVTGYHLSKDKLSQLQTHITYRQRFPLIEKFNWALIALIETRLYHREFILNNEITFQKAQRMSEQKKKDFRAISFNDLKFALVLLLAGNSISCVLFVLEISAGRYQKMVKEKTGLVQLVKWRNRSKVQRIQKIQVQPRI